MVDSLNHKVLTIFVSTLQFFRESLIDYYQRIKKTENNKRINESVPPPFSSLNFKL